MKKAYPMDPKERYEFLTDQAECWLNRSHPVAEKTIRQWRRRCLDWLREYTPDSDLPDSFLVVPQANLQRGLSVLIRARPIVSFLKESSVVRPLAPNNANKVFIVHGRDESLKNSVARLVERLGLEAVILHEQPNMGRTIIEKFMDCSDVGFAIVLLTADDIGGFELSSLKPRARQNVILELGFFLGRLGRDRVAAIYDSTVEMPSDYTGVLYVKYDDEGLWSLQIAKEMKAAGLKVDLNRL